MVFDKKYSLPSALVHFANDIFSTFCKLKFKKMQDRISSYSKALNLHWTKAFGEGNDISKTNVKQNLLLVVIDYF